MDIRTLTPTICKLMKIEPPSTSIPDVQENLVETLKRSGINTVEKCLVYAPDAVGRMVSDQYPDYFIELEHFVQHREALQSIDPPKTPVCFGSMFSGASPQVSGIKRYEKPVLAIETIFDSMVKAGKKAAIVAVQNSSIDLIFRNRAIDYFSETYDNEVIEKALSLLQDHDYDFLVVYNQEYDDCLHRTGPFSTESMRALQHHNRNYIRLVNALWLVWKNHSWLAAYTPDHGGHFSEADGVGMHGENIPEDMNLVHYYNFSSAH
jgi:hypothetical protein